MLLIPILFLWGLIHSILASINVKGYIKIWLGERAFRYYRFAYNIFAGISFLPILGLMLILPDNQIYSIPMPWAAISLIAQLLSLSILVIGLKQTGVVKFLGMDILFGEKNSEYQSLYISGLYKYVRHPLYSAGLILLWSSPIMTTNYILVSVCLSIYIFIGTLFEERKLIIEHGDDYRDYRKKVPMLIPGINWNK